MPFFTVDGQALHYLDQGTGPALLLGHSYLWDHTMWAPQITELSKCFRVIAPDLWGHGQSSTLPAGTQNLTDISRQTLALLDHLEIDKVSVIGLSVGGMWGIDLALTAPERVDQLVLMDTYAGAEPDATRNHYFALLAQIESAGEITSALLDLVVPIFFRPGIDTQSALYQSFRHSLESMSTAQLRDSIVPMGRIVFGRQSLLERLSELPAERTLLACGEYDQPRPPHEMHEMAELIGCPSILIPNAGHISSLENPRFVTQTLLAFLNR